MYRRQVSRLSQVTVTESVSWWFRGNLNSPLQCAMSWFMVLRLFKVVCADAGFVGEDAAADGVALWVVDDGAVGVELGTEAHKVFAGGDIE